MNAKFRRALFLLLAVVFLATTSLAVRPLHEMRRKYDLTNRPVKGLSPQLALTTQVLSWARGIIIDVLWIRMDTLKKQGRHYELVQLADWACKLAPHIPEVWDIQAWNMAYNISVQVDYFPDRWAWIKAGIELLREEAIPNNPGAPLLYQRLANLMLHKIGQNYDNAHFFYKRHFAQIMHRALGGSGDRAVLKRFAQAPDTRRELLEDSQVARLVENCRRFGFDIVDDYFLWYDGAEAVPEGVRDLLSKPYNVAPVRKIDAFARARLLQREHKLDPERMVELVDTYGPFDWRTPYPHVIYWAKVGLEQVNRRQERLDKTVEEFGIEPRHDDPQTAELEEKYGEKEDIYAKSKVNLEGLIYHALQDLVHHGRFQFSPGGRLLAEQGTDYRFADGLLEIYNELIEKWPRRYLGRVASALKFFLWRGVVEFHFMGDNQKSMEYYQMLCDRYPKFVGGLSYEEFLDYRIRKYTLDMSFEQLRNLVRNLFYRAFVAMGCGDDQTAAMMEAKARGMVKRFEVEDPVYLREKIRLEKLRDSALVNILMGRVGLSQEVLDNLKARLGAEKVETVMQRVRLGELAGPNPEDIPEDLQREPITRTPKPEEGPDWD